MARTYSDLIGLVRRWSNRDVEVAPNDIIADCLRYAADKAYRTLRVAPLEATINYTAAQLVAGTVDSNNRFSSTTELFIPEDLIEFIQIREIDNEGRTTRMFNEKTDVRTFNDLYAFKKNDFAYWTRQGNCVLLAPGFGNTGTNFGSTGVGEPSGIEMYYYRRLPALHARYDVSAANANLQLNSIILPTVVAGVSRLSTSTDAGEPEVIPVGTLNQETINGITTFVAPAAGTVGTVTLYGNTVTNWLKDENERIVLFGALAELFSYLQENEEAQKYGAMFGQEIKELNSEDQMRNASGGNIQVNYNGGLI